jgi:hypothetical protein
MKIETITDLGAILGVGFTFLAFSLATGALQ